jgi:hypothetical protein
MSKGPFLGCWAWEWDVGHWRLEVLLWPHPRFWQWSLGRYRHIARAFELRCGPLELTAVRAGAGDRE